MFNKKTEGCFADRCSAFRQIVRSVSASQALTLYRLKPSGVEGWRLVFAPLAFDKEAHAPLALLQRVCPQLALCWVMTCLDLPWL